MSKKTDVKHIKKVLNKVYVNRDELNTVCQDRLDFGFDSIYFRYALVRDSQALLQAIVTRGDINEEQRKADIDKMHFWKALEQLTWAHKHLKEETNDINC